MKELRGAGDRLQGGACGWQRGMAEGEWRQRGAGSRGKGWLGSRGERGRRAAIGRGSSREGKGQGRGRTTAAREGEGNRWRAERMGRRGEEKDKMNW